MQRLVFLAALAALVPVAADARPYQATVVLTIPSPNAAVLTFGEAPEDFAVAPGLAFVVSGATVTITSTSENRPLPRLLRLSTSRPVCFRHGMQHSRDAKAPIEQSSVQGMRFCR
jgi:hypothetical protein